MHKNMMMLSASKVNRTPAPTNKADEAVEEDVAVVEVEMIVAVVVKDLLVADVKADVDVAEPQEGNAHNQDGRNDNSNAFVLDNLDESANYYQLPSNIDNIIAIAATDRKQDISKILVLDSASTLNMVCDPDLLHDIHDVPIGINVRCNAGQVTITRQGYLGDFPEPVWLHTEGIVNILSFYIVQ